MQVVVAVKPICNDDPGKASVKSQLLLEGAHNSLRVGGIQRIHNFCSQLQNLLDSERLSAYPVLQRLPFKQLHGDEMLTVCFIDLVDREDVRMIEGGCSKGFPLESFASSEIVLQFLRQELQRDMAVELEVFGFVTTPIPPPPSFSRMR